MSRPARLLAAVAQGLILLAAAPALAQERLLLHGDGRLIEVDTREAQFGAIRRQHAFVPIVKVSGVISPAVYSDQTARLCGEYSTRARST